MKKLHRALLLAGGLVLTTMAVPPAEAQVQLQFRFGSPDRPLRGRQYQVMRGLARYLDEEAWEASNQANELVAYSRRSQAFIASINEFSERASAFNERMSSYETRPWDLPREITALDQSAQRVNYTIRRTRAYYRVGTQWNNVLDALNRMKQVLAGTSVELPRFNRRFGEYTGDLGFILGLGGDRDRRDGRRDYDGRRDATYREAGNYNPGGGVVVLSGRALDEFRDLARSLDQSVARTLETADRMQGGRNEPVLGDLRRFNDQVSDVWEQTDQEPVDARQWQPRVAQLREDARRLEMNLRRSPEFHAATATEWQRTMDILNRMEQTLR
jgi:hypothetical protein